MHKDEKQKILDKAKDWFRDVIAPNHKSNIAKATSFSDHNVNPFLVSYLAGVVGGELTAESVAKALLYPRVLGTSITTSFGQNIQSFLTTLFETYGSTTMGIDIEFIDALDNRKKYCQLKLGPNTINKDDVATIHGHFSAIRRLASTNSNTSIGFGDLVVGVMYGDEGSISSHYRKLRDEHNYALYVGSDFWHRFTGDANFYHDLQRSITEVANEFNLHDELREGVVRLAEDEEVKKLAGERVE